MLSPAKKSSEKLKDNIKQHVRNTIGSLAVPDELHVYDSLPKTRSGKIMRRLLRNIARGEPIQGDLSTIEDISIIPKDFRS